jgi:hypothetical protein
MFFYFKETLFSDIFDTHKMSELGLFLFNDPLYKYCDKYELTLSGQIIHNIANLYSFTNQTKYSH